MSTLSVLDLFGFAGVILLIIAYVLLQSGRLTSDQFRYPLLNFLGAGLIFVSLLGAWNASAALIEAVWMAISLYGMVSILRRRNKP